MEGTVEALNTVLNNYQGQCTHLEKIIQEDFLWMNKVVRAQEIYIRITQLVTTLNIRIEEFEDNLPIDKEGNPRLPVNGEVGYRFRPENIKEVHDRIEQTQQQARRALVKFKHDQDP